MCSLRFLCMLVVLFLFFLNSQPFTVGPLHRWSSFQVFWACAQCSVFEKNANLCSYFFPVSSIVANLTQQQGEMRTSHGRVYSKRAHVVSFHFSSSMFFFFSPTRTFCVLNAVTGGWRTIGASCFGDWQIYWNRPKEYWFTRLPRPLLGRVRGISWRIRHRLNHFIWMGCNWSGSWETGIVSDCAQAFRKHRATNDTTSVSMLDSVALNEFESSPSPLNKTLSVSLKAQLENYFNITEDYAKTFDKCSLFIVATFLDPRTKNFAFLKKRKLISYMLGQVKELITKQLKGWRSYVQKYKQIEQMGRVIWRPR